MPFKDPSGGAPEIPSDRYIVKVLRLEDADGQFGPQTKWVFKLANASTKETVKDDRGFDYEMFQYTGTSLAARSKARPWAEALLGHSIDDMTGEEVGKAVIGKTAVVLIADNDAGYPRIVDMKPIAKAATGGPAAPEPKPEPKPEPVGAAAGAAPSEDMAIPGF